MYKNVLLPSSHNARRFLHYTGVKKSSYIIGQREYKTVEIKPSVINCTRPDSGSRDSVALQCSVLLLNLIPVNRPVVFKTVTRLPTVATQFAHRGKAFDDFVK